MRIARLQINWLDDKEKRSSRASSLIKIYLTFAFIFRRALNVAMKSFLLLLFYFVRAKNYLVLQIIIWVTFEWSEKKGKKYVFQHNLNSFEVGEATLTGSMKMSVTFLFPLQSDSSIELLVQLVLRSLSLKADAISWSLLCNYTDWDAPTKPCY